MKKLKEIRMANNYSFEDMANFLNISKAFYWQIENQKRRLNYKMAIRIADVFKLKPDDIFYEDLKKEV